MLTVTYTNGTTPLDHYEYLADKDGISIIIDGQASEFRLIKLSLLSASSEGENIYSYKELLTLDTLDKPLIATINLDGVFPHYGVIAGNNQYGIVTSGEKDEVILMEIKAVPEMVK